MRSLLIYALLCSLDCCRDCQLPVALFLLVQLLVTNLRVMNLPHSCHFNGNQFLRSNLRSYYRLFGGYLFYMASDLFILVGWGLILIYLTKFHVPESLPVDKREKNALVSILRMKTDLLNLKFMLTVFSLSFVMGGFFSYLAASPFVFQKVYGFTPIEYSFTFAFIAICISIIASSAGRLSRRLSELKVVIIAYVLLLISGIGVLIISLVQPESFVPILGCLAIYCAMMGLSQSAGFGVVISFKKGGAGSASGIFGVMYF